MDIKIVSWQQYSSELQALRNTVFIEEQKVERTEEFDGLDDLPTTLHFAAFDGENLVGCARLLNTGKVGRMAVLAEYRKKGVGQGLLRETVTYALKNNVLNKDGDVYLHAQTQAKSFYEKSGFKAIGSVFQEAGIEHITMVFVPGNRDCINTLFEGRVIRLDDVDDVRYHLTQLCKITSRHINILSSHLDPTVFADDNFVNALSAMARKSRNSLIRILLRDSKRLHGLRHPLVDLSQRLSSKIEIRALTEEPQKPDCGYLVSDINRLVYFNNEETFQGFANYRGPAEVQHELEEFNNLWNRHSEVDPNLIRLSI